MTIFEAIRSRSKENIEFVLHTDPVSKLKLSENGEMPIHIAVELGDFEIVKLLVENGAALDQDNISGCIPLDIAIIRDYSDIFFYLLPLTPTHRVTLTSLLFSKNEDIRKVMLSKFSDKINEPLPPNHGKKNTTKQTILTEAAANGNTQLMEDVINNGGEVNKADINGRTPLIWASYTGHPEIVDILCNKGADINQADSEGNTAIMVAASQSLECVERLLQEKADVKKQNKNSQNVLHMAIMGDSENKSQLIKSLVGTGEINVNQRDKDGFTPFFYGALKNETESLETLISIPEVDVNIGSFSNDKPVHTIIKNNQVGLIHNLIKNNKKPDFNDADNKGQSSIFFAESPEMAETLFKNGADLDKTDNNGRSALISKLMKGDTKTSSSLINLGSRIDIADNDGNNAFMHAISSCDEVNIINLNEKIKTFPEIEQKNYLNTRNNEGQSIAHKLCKLTSPQSTNILQSIMNTFPDMLSFSEKDFKDVLPIEYSITSCNGLHSELLKKQPSLLDNIRQQVIEEARTDVKTELIHARMQYKYDAKNGKIVIGLNWNDWNDLDLKLKCPSGQLTHYDNKICKECSAELDVDMNMFGNFRITNKKNSIEPVEHIVLNNPIPGAYEIRVHFIGHFDKKISKFNLFLVEDNRLLFFGTSDIQPAETIHCSFVVEEDQKIIFIMPSNNFQIKWDVFNEINTISNISLSIEQNKESQPQQYREEDHHQDNMLSIITKKFCLQMESD